MTIYDYNSKYHAENVQSAIFNAVHSVAERLQLRGFKLISRYKDSLLVFDERFEKDRGEVKASPYCVYSATTGDCLNTYSSIADVLTATNTTELDWINNDEPYWLGATFARYRMASDEFVGGNCGIYREQTCYSDSNIDEGKHISYQQAFEKLKK